MNIKKAANQALRAKAVLGSAPKPRRAGALKAKAVKVAC